MYVKINTFSIATIILMSSQLKCNTENKVKVSKPAVSSVNFRFNIASLFVAPVKRRTSSVHQHYFTDIIVLSALVEGNMPSGCS